MLLSSHLSVEIFVVKMLNNVFVEFILNYYEKTSINNDNIFERNFSFIL